MFDFCGGNVFDCLFWFLDLELWQQIAIGLGLCICMLIITRVFHWITMGVDSD